MSWCKPNPHPKAGGKDNDIPKLIHDDGNFRSSIGAELRNAVVGFNANYYIGLDDL